MRLPIVDHANSVRAAVDEALTLEQVIDYAPFGAVSRIRDGAGNEITNSSGKPNLLALDTVFTHHDSALDAATELQLKGRRWYDPDSGKFLSEDPIAADINTYRFAGNDPTNYGDPTGLSQAGHPLNGGFSGGGLFQTPILSGNIKNFINSTSSWAPRSTPSIDFSRPFDASLTAGGTARPNLTSSSFQAAPTTSVPLGVTNFIVNGRTTTSSPVGAASSFRSYDIPIGPAATTLAATPGSNGLTTADRHGNPWLDARDSNLVTPADAMRIGIQNGSISVGRVRPAPDPSATTVAEFAGGAVFEPIDWALTAREIYNDPGNLFSYAGLLPIVPAGSKKLISQVDGSINDAVQKAIDFVSRRGDAPVITPKQTRFVDGVSVVDRRTGQVLNGTTDLKPTLDRIKSGGSFPHRNDGSVFRNRRL